MRASLLLVVAAIAAYAFGQSSASFDLQIANITILQDKAIQKELGITEAQRTKMNGHAQTYEKSARAHVQAEQKAGRNPGQNGPDPKMLGFFNTLRQRVLSELRPPQVKRLRELTLQQAGLAGMLDPAVATRLGITPSTLSQMQNVFSDGRNRAGKIESDAIQAVLKPYEKRQPKDEKELAALRKEVDPKVAAARRRVQPQIQAIQNDTQKKMLALVSKKQRDDYLALQGKLFRGK